MSIVERIEISAQIKMSVGEIIDIYSKSKRKDIMSKIKSQDTKPEIMVRKWLFSQGFRFRKNDKRYPGKPDIVLPKYKTMIFINGCFWHGHEGCINSELPKTNIDFWKDKIEKNKINDENSISKIEEMGYNVIVIWQCQLSNKKKRSDTLSQLKQNILKNLDVT